MSLSIFPKRARRDDPVGHMVVQENLDKLKADLDRALATISTALATQPVVVRGSVDATGVVVSGTGFTSSRTSAGLYVVTFNTPFTNPPEAVATAGSPSQVAAVTVVSTTSITVSTRASTTGAVNDSPFTFIAYSQ